MKNRKLLIGVGVFILLCFTNPSKDDFTGYLYANGIHPYGYGRTANFLIFSKYKDHGKTYIGVLGNFF